MAQSVSCGTLRWEGVRGWREGTVNPENLASCWRSYCVDGIAFFHTCAALFNSQRSLPKMTILHPLLKATNRRAASLGYCRKSGPLCWVCKVCNTGLGTGYIWVFSFLSFFLSFKSNQARSQLPTLSGGFSKEQKLLCDSLHCRWKKKLKRNPIQYRYSTCVCVCTLSLVFQPYSFLQEDYFPDNLTLSSIYLSLQ